MSNSLTKKDYYTDLEIFENNSLVEIFNPLSIDLNVMRQSLLFGGLESIAYNANRKSPSLKLYEFGTCYFKYTDDNIERSTGLFVSIAG